MHANACAPGSVHRSRATRPPCRLESGEGGGKDESDDSIALANGATGSFDAKGAQSCRSPRAAGRSPCSCGHGGEFDVTLRLALPRRTTAIVD